MAPPKPPAGDLKVTVSEADLFRICRYTDFVPGDYVTQQAQQVASAESKDVTGDGKAEYIETVKMQTWQCPGKYTESNFKRIRRFGDSNVYINTSKGQKIDIYDVVTLGGKKYYVKPLKNQDTPA